MLRQWIRRRLTGRSLWPRRRTRMAYAEVQREYPGLWVAVKNGDVVAARLTPHALVLELEERGIKDATVFRTPAEEEPELVGLG